MIRIFFIIIIFTGLPKPQNPLNKLINLKMQTMNELVTKDASKKMQAMNIINWMKKRHHHTAKLQYKNDPVQLKKLKALIYIFKKYDKD